MNWTSNCSRKIDWLAGRCTCIPRRQATWPCNLMQFGPFVCMALPERTGAQAHILLHCAFKLTSIYGTVKRIKHLKSAFQVIQCFENKVIKCIVQAPWYIRNSDLHRDLRIETVTDIITRLARLQNHINSEVSRPLNVQNIPRRLKRKKQLELVRQQTTKWFSGSDLAIKYLKL
jgi:hypothetical protein